ncbi:hypothetical protein BJF93_05860 [Xaviernesmea oryzae]|uniref:Polysaccharide chain length determinant N-terminal domain-containing protein n=1 Tax=Xaviernesmea oryzae TaxID=464029 RepID=A0A1Q9ARZ1_9HYPH|nr:GumC family protein [Xaviernesmea oryzae]OLP58151.1 hypothetical protein BJF93_05860 [Xaviernesmea oryzae]SEL80939.1 Uncharacterized protein involved in exopolysaccharide biosynthesis [Xaviernesmea oryzae]
MFQSDETNRAKPLRSLLDLAGDGTARGDVTAAPAATVPTPMQRNDGPAPLIDVVTVFHAIWDFRKLIMVTTILGGLAGAGFAVLAPSHYVSESKLYIDPREVQLTDSDLSKQTLATEGILALVDSQLEVLRSRTVLERVARELGLARDPEFAKVDAAAVPAGGGVAENQTEIDPRILEKLSDALTVGRDPKTFIVTVQVKTRDARKSALITNAIVNAFLDEERQAQSSFFKRTTNQLDSRLEELRKDLDVAESAVEAYKAKHDIVNVSGQLISDQQLLSLNQQVGEVRNRIAEARAKAGLANQIRLNDILSGAFPEEIASATLQELRKQYAQARSQLSAMEASLGPRHPQRLAAAQALESARTEIGNELRRIAASTQTELQRALRTEQDLLQQLATRKAQQVDNSSSYIELRELERKANATRAIYETFLKRAGETGEEEKLTSRNIRVIAEAEPALKPTGLSRKIIALAGLLGGFALGMGVAVLVGLARSTRALMAQTRMVQEVKAAERSGTPAPVASDAPVNPTAPPPPEPLPPVPPLPPEPQPPAPTPPDQVKRRLDDKQRDLVTRIAEQAPRPIATVPLASARTAEDPAAAEFAPLRTPGANASKAPSAEVRSQVWSVSSDHRRATSAARAAARRDDGVLPADFDGLSPEEARAIEPVLKLRADLRRLRAQVEDYYRQTGS